MKLFDVYPLFNISLAKAEGCWVWDEAGNKYLDLYGGHAVISIGHSHPHYINSLSSQLNNIGFYSNAVKMPLQEELANKLGELSGYDDYQLFLCNSGAEANENALKLASFHNGRKKIISFSKSFHGRTSLAVATTDDPSIQAEVNKTPDVIILPFNDLEALRKNLTGEIAAVIIEGIQGVGGVHIPTNEFFKELRKLCTETGALLILDEIQSGYGRSGKFFAHQYSGIRPDIISMAKGMGNGFPVAGILIHPDIKPRHGMLGTTFGGNYLACRAAIAVLDVIKKENLVKNALETGEYLTKSLSGLPGIKEIRGLGLMIGIVLDQPCAPLRKALLEKHRIFTGSSSDKNTLRILPPLTISRKEIDLFAEKFKSEFVPAPVQ
jgi:acetylornithine/N-succinyldiaminopimelate aminotransferase